MFVAVVYVRRQTVVGKKPLKLDISIARAFHKASLLKTSRDKSGLFPSMNITL